MTAARKRFLYNGILLTLAALAVKSAQLFFSSALSKHVGTEAIGLYTLIGSVYSFAVTFASAGVTLTVTRLVAAAIGEGKEKEIAGIVKSAVIYALIFSGAASIALGFGAEYLSVSVLSDSRAALSLKILSLSLIPIALCAVFSGYFIGVRRVKRSSFVGVSSQILKMILSLTLAVKFIDTGVEYVTAALCLGGVISELFAFIFSLVLFLFEKLTKSKSGQEHFSAVSKMALPLAVSAYIRSALLTLEHVLIPECLRSRGENSAQALSSYGLLHGMALPVILYPMTPLSSFASLLVPEFAEIEARKDKRRMCRITEEVLSSVVFYSVPIAVALAFFSEELGYVLFSSYDAGRYILTLSPVIPIMYLDHVTDSILKGIGEHVYSMWVNISDSVLSIVLILFLIPRFGILGYGLVIIIMEAFNFILSFVRLKKKIPFRKKLVPTFLLSLVMSLFSVAVADFLMPYSGSTTGAYWLFVKFLFATCVFLVLFFAARQVRQSELKKTNC